MFRSCSICAKKTRLPAKQAELQLFERFFRAHESITDIEGTGLGLSIVREVTESVGGRAWAEYPEVGSVFAIALPLRRQPDAIAAAKAMTTDTSIEVPAT